MRLSPVLPQKKGLANEFPELLIGKTYIFDFLNAKIRVGRNADGVWPDIDNDHNRTRYKAFEEIVDLLIGRS
jgi:hypothetical protein